MLWIIPFYKSNDTFIVSAEIKKVTRKRVSITGLLAITYVLYNIGKEVGHWIEIFIKNY
jgi:hypothetical protein